MPWRSTLQQNIIFFFKKKSLNLFHYHYYFYWTHNKIQNFSFSHSNDKEKKTDRERHSQLLDESKNEYKETDSGTLDTNDVGEGDYISKKSAYESSNDNILDEFLQTQETMMNYISKDKKEIGNSQPLGYST